ncbi:MAG: molecular chaperone TorD family protein [Burkholderiales bacterium]|nr:molecular chaperone TorD family protein [Burkholderiales bacterium]
MAKQLEENTTIIPPSGKKPGRLAVAMNFPELIINESSLFGSPGDSEEAEPFYRYLGKRKNFYKMLARFYISEPSPEFIRTIVAYRFPVPSNNSDLNKGVSQLMATVKDGGINLNDLENDYVRTFHGAKAKTSMAIPYESAYTSPSGKIMQDAFEKVLRIFYAYGFDCSGYDRHPDHAGLELGFMSYLCRKSQEAIEKANPSSLCKTLADQQKFLDAHILNWMPEFLVDVRHFSVTPFYQSAAQMTSGFLQLEKDQFANC